MKREVVVTGMGLITALGADKNTFWQNILSKKTGFKACEFNFSPFNSFLAGHIENGYISNDDYQILRANRLCQFAVETADKALIDSGLNNLHYDPYRMGVSFGTHIGYPAINQFGDMLQVQSSQYIYHHSTAGIIAIRHQTKGPTLTFTMGESSGNVALGWAARQISWDKADLMIAGGGDILSRFNFLHYFNSGKLINENGTNNLCKPFDKNRKGTILSEAFAFLILEEKKQAEKRKAKIYAEIIDFNCFYQQKGSLKAAIEAVAKNINQEKDLLIFASANGTKEDEGELRDLNDSFLGNGKNVFVTSIKGYLGESQAASGPLNIISSLLTMESGIIPPTLGLKNPVLIGNLTPLREEETISKGIDIVLSYQQSYWGDAAVLLVEKK